MTKDRNSVEGKVFISRSTKEGGSYLKGTTPPSPSKEKSSTKSVKSNLKSNVSSDKGYRSYNHGSYNRYGCASYTVSPSMPVTKAFSIDGILFHGSAQSKLDMIDFEEHDLVINCTHTWTPKKAKPFIKSSPDWLDVDSIDLKIKAYEPDVIHLDWPDMSTPPDKVDRDFWVGLYGQIKNAGVKKVFVCCTAGQGRTGTSLACLMIASGLTNDSRVAIEYIRQAYSSNAVETQKQENYVDFVAYGYKAFDKDFRIKIGLDEAPKGSDPSTTLSVVEGGKKNSGSKVYDWPDDDFKW